MQQTAFRAPAWSGIGAVLAAAVFLWVGFILAMILIVAGTVAVLGTWLRLSWTRRRARRAARAPVTLEGRYSRQ